MSSQPPQAYDIIGDVHGCYDQLIKLLERLDYKPSAQGYWHPEKKVVFLGDIVDRGPQIRPALELVRTMVTSGHAHIVFGNHEYNLIAYHTLRADGSGEYLHRRIPRHSRNIQQTLEQFAGYEEQLHDHIAWLRTLPFFLELAIGSSAFRCVHACWHPEAIALIKQQQINSERPESFWQASIDRESWQKFVFDCCCRGLQLKLPRSIRLLGNDGSYHSKLRVQYWKPNCRTYGDIALTRTSLSAEVAAIPLSAEQQRYFYCYGPEEPPLFFGHYWFKGTPEIISSNVACLDYSAVRGGKLVAYSYQGEAKLSSENLVAV